MWYKSKTWKALLLTFAITFSLTGCTNSQTPASNGNGNGNPGTFSTQSGTDGNNGTTGDTGTGTTGGGNIGTIANPNQGLSGDSGIYDPRTPPNLVISPASYNFQIQSLNSLNYATFTVTNTGQKPASSVGGTGLSGPYSFRGGSFPGLHGTCTGTLGPSASCTVVVEFQPTSLGQAPVVDLGVVSTGPKLRPKPRLHSVAAPRISPHSISMTAWMTTPSGTSEHFRTASPRHGPSRSSTGEPSRQRESPSPESRRRFRFFRIPVPSRSLRTASW